MYLDLGVAQKINALEPRRNEPINICKRWTGKRNDDPQWDIWRSGPGETPPAPVPVPTPQQFASAATSIPETELERDLRLSLPWRDGPTLQTNQAGAGVLAPAPAAATQVAAFNTGNGSTPATNGTIGKNGSGGNAKPYVAAGIPVPPAKIPANIAFVEIVKLVSAGLHETGEQWSDQARQDAFSTIYIQAARDGWIAPWERGGK